MTTNSAKVLQTIDNLLQVNALKVGQQGVGGVTNFNRTIINETTDEDGNGIPVTFGGDVRIDGRVYRGTTAGTSDSKPFIVNDNMEVVGSLTVGSTNILHGHLKLEQDNLYLYLDEKNRVLVPMLGNWQELLTQEKVYVSIRPEKVELSKSPLIGFANHVVGTVSAIIYHGRSTQYNIALVNGTVMQVFEQNEEHFPKETIDYDEVVNVYWQTENSVLLKS